MPALLRSQVLHSSGRRLPVGRGTIRVCSREPRGASECRLRHLPNVASVVGGVCDPGVIHDGRPHRGQLQMEQTLGRLKRWEEVTSELFVSETTMPIRLEAGAEPVSNYTLVRLLGRGGFRRGLGGHRAGPRAGRAEVHPAQYVAGRTRVAGVRDHPRHPAPAPPRHPVRRPGGGLPGDRHAPLRPELEGPTGGVPAAGAIRPAAG